MPDMIHKTEMKFYPSQDETDGSWPTETYLYEPIWDPDKATILAVPELHRKITGGDTVEEMTAEEKLDKPLPGVDFARSHGYKDPVHAATTAALPAHSRSGNVLTMDANGALPAQDGETLTVGQRLLVKNEGGGTHLENGPYIYATVGDGTHPSKLQRSSDCASSALVCCCLTVRVMAGTVNEGKKFKLVTMGAITLNTTALKFISIEEELQTVTKQSGAYASGSATIPFDNSIPQKGEGDERLVMDPFTPKSAKSKLKISGECFLWSDCEDPITLIAAVFVDDANDAIGAGCEGHNFEFPMACVSFSFEIPSGSTAARTYKVRVGGSEAGNTTINGDGEAKLGGVLFSSITVTEIG